jgi:hypothetical protein
MMLVNLASTRMARVRYAGERGRFDASKPRLLCGAERSGE